MSATQTPEIDWSAALPPEAALRVERETSTASTVVVLRLVGELDMLTSPRLTAALRAELERGRHVELNLAGVTFLATRGIEMLLDAHHAAQRRGTELSITGATHRAVARPLSLIGVDGVLPLVDRPTSADVVGLFRLGAPSGSEVAIGG